MRQSNAPLWRAVGGASDFDVVGLGENSLDHICLLDELPEPGQKCELAHYDARPGGQVASALLGCARLGLRASYIGAVGADAAGERVLEPLERAGVDLTGVRVLPAAGTRTAVVLIRRRDGERTVLARRDPRLRLIAAQLEAKEVERARVLHIDASDPDASEWAARAARAVGIPVVLDADHLWPGAERLLRVTDFPVVARELAEELGGTGSAADGLRALLRWGARLAVATCGDEGALARSSERSFLSPAFEIEVRDTTGAGDAFHAGFIWGLLRGFDTERVLRAANAVAGLSCMALGAQQGLPRSSELEAFLRSRRDVKAKSSANGKE